jgi:hypothetical protein
VGETKIITANTFGRVGEIKIITTNTFGVGIKSITVNTFGREWGKSRLLQLTPLGESGENQDYYS